MKQFFTFTLSILLNYSTSFAQPIHPSDYELKHFTINDSSLGLISFYIDTVNLDQQAPLFIYENGRTKDKNSPVYGLDYVLLDFIRLGKTNLTYKTCVGCDHFLISKEGNKTIHHKYFDKILAWIDKN